MWAEVKIRRRASALKLEHVQEPAAGCEPCGAVWDREEKREQKPQKDFLKDLKVTFKGSLMEFEKDSKRGPKP